MPYRIDRVALAAALLDELTAERVRGLHAPASSWALVTPEGVVATGGAGDGLTPGTAFRVASCTKSFTAAALSQVVDAGGAAFDQPLDDVLDVRVLGAARAPTLGELAGMTGGIPIDDPWADRQESMPAAEFDAMLAAGLRLAREPGTRYEYSSYGYSILGRVLERVTGRPYPALIRERLLEPLGLTELGLDRGSVGAESIAAGFHRVDGEWVEQPWAGPGAFSPLGGMIATPRGLGRWASWLASAWREDAADDVLAAASRRRMQEGRTPVPGTVASAYGLGLVVEEDPRHGRVVSHSGGYPGFGAHMRWHAESGIGVVVLENARYSGATRPATRALSAVLDAALAPAAAPDLWAATREAREVVERLLRRFDEGALAALAADDLALDEPLDRRGRELARLAAAAGPAEAVLDLVDASPWSDSPAHLSWSVPGRTASLRCEIRLTPLAEPTLQTLTVRLG